MAFSQCPPPEAISASTQANIFTAAQELQLGDIAAQSMGINLHTIEDQAVTGNLYEIGSRLLRYFPKNSLRLQFFIVDSPEVNAFAIPGGRIYVTRKLIATARTEDELAAVIAHEIGHQLSHHSAIEMTRLFRKLLGITSLADGVDVAETYHEMMDEYWNKGESPPRMDVNREQGQADRVAVYALARAGYSPQAAVEFFDRIMETKGRTGTWLSGLFGTTSPEGKRLREFVKNVAGLPADCLPPAAERSPNPDAFLAWREKVRSYTGYGKTEKLHGVLMRRSLEPALRSEIENLRFSPDGKLLLAQDDASIFVLSREPLQTLFRIDARHALPARFSPDSKFVVFHTTNLRVERWSVAERRREDVFEVYRYRGCMGYSLSPDGGTLACVREAEGQPHLELLLLDVASGEPKFTKKTFGGNQVLLAMFGVNPRIRLSFSPDGHYFVGVNDKETFAYDTAVGQEIPVAASVRKLLELSFAWVGSDAIIGVAGDKGRDSEMVNFPEGKVLASKLAVGLSHLQSVTHGKFVLVGPLVTAPVGIFDIAKNKIVVGSKVPAVDIYDDVFANERKGGEIGLYPYTEAPAKPLAVTSLPAAPLGPTLEAAVSPDLDLFALSGRTRSAVWKLSTGERLLYLVPFDEAVHDGSGFVASMLPADALRARQVLGQKDEDYLRQEREKPGHTVARLNLTSRIVEPLTSYKRLFQVRLNGPYTVLYSPAKPEGSYFRDVNLEVRETASGKVLWTRHFEKETPLVRGSMRGQYTLLVWSDLQDAVSAEIKDDPALKKRFNAHKPRAAAYLIEVVETQTGKLVSKFLVETGQPRWFGRLSAYASHDMVFTVDGTGRITMYSVSGERKGRMFGAASALSSAGLIAVEGEPGRLALYDVTSLTLRDEFTFAADVTYTAFSADARKLLVLTQDQTVYVLDVSGLTGPRAAN